MIRITTCYQGLCMMLALLMMQGCSSMELAIDLYKKTKA